MVDTDLHLGFVKKLSELRNNIFIPKYYNPEIDILLDGMEDKYELLTIKELANEGLVSYSTGHEIGKMTYGTGPIPFIRTSDIANWEIKADPKQGVSDEIYRQYTDRQDIKSGDIFMVRDGTYLIGQSCMVTEGDLPCLYQSHVLKFRVNDSQKIDKYLFFAALNSPLVQLQIKARKFTADIIDTLGNRFLELVLPVPKSEHAKGAVREGVKTIIKNRAALREEIKYLPIAAEGRTIEQEKEFLRLEQSIKTGFIIKSSNIKNGIFVPKYYNFEVDAELETLSETYNLKSLQDLVDEDVISWSTGIEVGKMAYGTGTVPFIRTSDLSNWELKRDPKQGVSQSIYEDNKQDVIAKDILLVRDGTYLVGTSCMITKHDEKILYAGGLYKLRVEKPEILDPYLLLTLLNAPIARRQMRSKQFTRDIIDTLGKRLFEIILPIPQEPKKQAQLSNETMRVIDGRANLRAAIAKTVAFEE